MEERNSKDSKTQTFVASMQRKISRRNFINKLAVATAGLVAILIINPRDGLQMALAHGTPCAPPHGQMCSGCRLSNGTCPTSYSTCTRSNAPCGTGLCPYAGGFWYSEGGSSGHICRDCKLDIAGPADPPHFSRCDRGAKVSGRYVLCACRSTTHY